MRYGACGYIQRDERESDVSISCGVSLKENDLFLFSIPLLDTENVHIEKVEKATLQGHQSNGSLNRFTVDQRKYGMLPDQAWNIFLWTIT